MNIFSRLVSFSLILLLSPIMILISILVLFDDGQPIMFKQKRIGQNNNHFWIYKFRTMKKGTKDIATHLLKDEDLSYTAYGPLLRSLSLDELPQLINIFKGDMTFIGPRPALHNQHDLIALRENRGINMLMPGLTGWAQVNGRDELDINEKVRLDYYYLVNKSVFLNIKILWMTFIKVINKDGVTI